MGVSTETVRKLLAVGLVSLCCGAGCAPKEPEGVADVFTQEAPDVQLSPPDTSQDATDVLVEQETRLVSDSYPEVDARAPEDDVAKAVRRYPLVDNSLWVEVSPDEDMFFAEAGDKLDVCPESEYWAEEMPEGLVFEVNTTFCAYLTVRQDLLVDLPAQAQVDISIAHYEIVDGDGGYYLAVAVGTPPMVLWEKSIEVGQFESTYDETFAIPSELTAGDEVLFHISNHGDNHWFLVDLSVEI